MTEPIKSKRLHQLAGAPTPQNTPATAASSFATRLGAGQPSVATISEEGGEGLPNALALLQSIQGNLTGLIGKSSGYIEGLPRKVQDRILGLRSLQSEHSKLESEFHKELLDLEKKYLKLYTPNYEKRAAFISGAKEPTAEEIEFGRALKEERDGEDDEDENINKADKQTPDDEDDEEDETIKGIPNFWLTAMTNLAPLAENINDRDWQALSSLVDIRLRYLEKPGFALDFEFEKNEFFTNKILTKSYYYQEETGYGGEFIYERAEGDTIKWISPSQDLTIKIEKRKQRNKHTKATRTVEKKIPADSFFNFFNPPVIPQDEDEDNTLDEEELHDLEIQLELDYALGEEFKDKLIPRAIDWFTGDALDYEGEGGDLYEDEDDDENEDEDEDDDDDDSENDDEDEEEDAGTRLKKAAAASGQQAPECKQS